MPALMLFPSGLPPAPVLQEKDGLKVELLRKTSAKRKQHQELHAETETMRYSGQNYGREGAAAKAGGSLLIGVHNRRTGVTRLLPPSALYVMHQSVKEPQVALGPAAAPDAAAAAPTYGAQKRQLISTLGAAKARKRQDQMAAASVSADAVFNAASLSADIGQAAEAAHLAASAPEFARNEADLRPLHPPFDMGATSVEAAYPRSGMIPEHVWQGLDYGAHKDLAKLGERRAQLLKEGGPLWPSYILGCLGEAMPSAKSSRHAHLKQLTYLTYMLRFYGISGPIKPKKRDVGRGDYQPEAAKLQIAMPAWEQLVAEYSENDTRDGIFIPAEDGAGAGGGGGNGSTPKAPKRIVTRTCKEKLCIHTLALALVLKDGRLSCAALAASLSLTEEKTAFYLRQLGCSIEGKGSGGKVAVLKLPLTFPKLSRGGPAKR